MSTFRSNRRPRAATIVAGSPARSALAAALALAGCASIASAQVGAAFIDARSNIYGYGVTTPAPSGGGGGVVATTINLTPGASRTATFLASGSAWWSAGPGSNGPDGGNFASSTFIPAFGAISAFSAPRSGHLLGLFLGPNDPVGFGAPPAFSYTDEASFTLASYAPLLQQVFFIGDGLTGTGSGDAQTFIVPDSATRLVLGIADSFAFNGTPGFYDDNRGGYQLEYAVVPAPSALALVGLGGMVIARRRR